MTEVQALAIHPVDPFAVEYQRLRLPGRLRTGGQRMRRAGLRGWGIEAALGLLPELEVLDAVRDRKSTRLNSSHI